MKKQIILLMLIVATALSGRAQVSVQFNLGVQPVWGPVGYDYVENYYLPDIDAYYYVPTHEYVYLEGGTWVRRPSLPPRYSNYDIYHAHKVVINDHDPWMRHEQYRNQYGRYRGMHDQHMIRESRDRRYYENPEHPRHNEWHGNNGNHGGENHEHGDRGHEGHGHEGHR